MSLASIQNEIQKLEPAERASLIDLLWDSLDAEHIKEIAAKWAAGRKIESMRLNAENYLPLMGCLH